jgi:N-acetylneuraminic acid mutarotase
MNADHCYHSATLLPNGQVLIAGSPTTPTVELFNPQTGTWTITGSMNVTRRNGIGILLQNGKVLVAGGNVYNGPTSTASAEIYDPITRRWIVTDSMHNARQLQSATLLNNGKVLIAGGDTNNSTSNSAEIFSYFYHTYIPMVVKD